jgi:hypothetical protein
MGPERQLSDRMCITLVEELQAPLTRMARLAEFNGTASATQRRALLGEVEIASSAALRLIDAYLMTQAINQDQTALELQPTSLSAVMNDIAHILSPIAKQQRCSVELSLAGRYEPVMAHRQALEHALASMGYMMIESLGSPAHAKPVVLRLGLHRSRSGLVTGIFGDIDSLRPAAYRRARQLFGRARQPLASLAAGSGAGLFIADQLMTAQQAPLKVVRHRRQIGFGATFSPSQQLAFI